jgi:hypothetical protein
MLEVGTGPVAGKLTSEQPPRSISATSTPACASRHDGAPGAAPHDDRPVAVVDESHDEAASRTRLEHADTHLVVLVRDSLRERSSASNATSQAMAARPLGGESRGSWLPIHYPNPRDLPVTAGNPLLGPAARKPAVCRHIRAESPPHVLLAMQVEGSNPISRFVKGLHLQVFFVGAVGWCVCVAG